MRLSKCGWQSGVLQSLCIVHYAVVMERKGLVRAKNTHRFNMVLTEADLVALDQFRRIELDLPNRSEAIRRLIHRAVGDQ